MKYLKETKIKELNKDILDWFNLSSNPDKQHEAAKLFRQRNVQQRAHKLLILNMKNHS